MRTGGRQSTAWSHSQVKMGRFCLLHIYFFFPSLELPMTHLRASCRSPSHPYKFSRSDASAWGQGPHSGVLPRLPPGYLPTEHSLLPGSSRSARTNSRVRGRGSPSRTGALGAVSAEPIHPHHADLPLCSLSNARTSETSTTPPGSAGTRRKRRSGKEAMTDKGTARRLCLLDTRHATRRAFHPQESRSGCRKTTGSKSQGATPARGKSWESSGIPPAFPKGFCRGVLPPRS